MPTLPRAIMALLEPFRPLFTAPTWRKAQILAIGAILTPGARTVSAALRAVGLAEERAFSAYHHVLNRAVWSTLSASRILLNLLLSAFVPAEEPILVGLDETIERRTGPRIQARGVYRDPVRSSKSHFVKAMGLRWLVSCLIVRVAFSPRRWALPFLTVLAPSERYYTTRGRAPKSLTERAGQLLAVVRRWLPERRVIVLGDQTYAALDLLARCVRLDVTAIVRLRLDAALYAPAPPRRPGQVGRPRKKGERLPSLAAQLVDPATVWQRVTLAWYDQGEREVELASGTAVWYSPGKPVVPIRWVLLRDPLGRFQPQALLSTQLTLTPVEIVRLFLHRWQIEVTFEEVRAHLGVETQRQWSDRAIARTTPLLLGLFSWLTLVAHQLHRSDALPIRTAAWYPKSHVTFSDVIAAVRRSLWPAVGFLVSGPTAHPKKPPPSFHDHLINLLCYAA
jgi:hypothetical protein